MGHNPNTSCEVPVTSQLQANMNSAENDSVSDPSTLQENLSMIFSHLYINENTDV